MSLRRRHRVHKVGGVNRLCLRLRVEQLWVEGAAQKGGINGLALGVIVAAIVTVGKEVEIDVGGIVLVDIG